MGLIMCIPIIATIAILEPAPYILKIAAVALLAELARSIAWPKWRLRFAELLRTGWLVQGRCPACGTVIAELDPEADGCRVCPECGAAWRIEA